MQTFLPYANYIESARCLDRQRLGKQRIEVVQILDILVGGKQSRWAAHTAVSMWRGFEYSLCEYGLAVCSEWVGRGYADNQGLKIAAVLCELEPGPRPLFADDQAFIDSHRSNLLRKDPLYYSKFRWEVPHDLPYVWPK